MTTINVEYLNSLGACSKAIQFVKQNNLEHFPVSRINEIEGDHLGWIMWIKDVLNSVREYDSNGNVIHNKDSDGSEYWREYDSNGNMIHYKDSYGYEYWMEYDSNGNEIHYKNSDGYEEWKEYDSNGNEIHYKKSNGYEYWMEYDSNGNEIHFKDSNGYEYWKEYDSNGNMIHYKNSDGYKCSYRVEYYPSGQLKQYENMVLPDLNDGMTWQPIETPPN